MRPDTTSPLPKRRHFRLHQVALATALAAATTVQAQDISQIGKSDPLIISGSIGTQNTYYHSSTGAGYMSPLSNTVFANLNVSIYGFSMPFSLYYSNDNLSFNHPQLSFNLTPRYKNFVGHIGQSTMYNPQNEMFASYKTKRYFP